MRASYTIFPQSGYVLETFRGAIVFAELLRFADRQMRDPRVLQRYHTVSDYTQASLRLSDDEVRQLTDTVCAASGSRFGKRAMVIAGPRNFGFANLFQSCLSELQIQSRCFRYREAAQRWLLHTEVEETEEVGLA